MGVVKGVGGEEKVKLVREGAIKEVYSVEGAEEEWDTECGGDEGDADFVLTDTFIDIFNDIFD